MLGFDFASPNLRATSDKVWPQFDDQPVCHLPQNRAGNTRPVLSNLPVIAQIEATVQIAKVIAASLPGNLSANAPLLIDICLQTHFQLRTVSRKILFHRSIIKRYRHIIAGASANGWITVRLPLYNYRHRRRRPEASPVMTNLSVAESSAPRTVFR